MKRCFWEKKIDAALKKSYFGMFLSACQERHADWVTICMDGEAKIEKSVRAVKK